jgi:hypothetical protein
MKFQLPCNLAINPSTENITKLASKHVPSLNNERIIVSLLIFKSNLFKIWIIYSSYLNQV